MTNDEGQRFQIDLEIKRSGLAPATVQSYFRDCRALFNQLHKYEKININPVAEIEAISVPKSQRVRSKTYTIQDIVSILDAPYKHPEGFPIKEFFELSMELGTRAGELINLEWTDIDLDNALLRIQEKPLCPTASGLGFKPKSGTDRVINLTNRAVEVFKSIQVRECVGYIKNDDVPYPANFVFVTKDYRHKKSPNRGGWCRPNSIRSSWESLLKSAGLPYRGFDKSCLHDLRRFRNQVDKHLNRMSDEDRSKKLGHSVKVNKDHYTPSSFDQKISALSAENESIKRENLLLREKLRSLDLTALQGP